MKAREFERFLRAAGCTLEETKDDHHIWRLPNGRRLLVPFGGKHSNGKVYLLAKFNRLMREAS